MSIAANAVADLAGPPPPRAATNAADDSRDAPSFQDHVQENVDATDRAAPQPKSDARPQATQSRSSDQSSEPSDETTAPAKPTKAEDEHTDVKSEAVPIFLQLIANAIAPIVGAKVAQAPQQQENPQTTQTGEAAAQAANTQASSAQAAALASTIAPIKVAPKTDATGRPAPVKTTKGATEKTEITPPAANAAIEVTEPEREIATPVALAANLAQPGAGKSNSDAKSEAVAGVQAAPPHAGHAHEQRPASPSAPSPVLAPETSPQAPDAKPRDDGKALALAEALKQATQDFAPAAPKAQPSPSTQPATLAAHAQLAAQAELVPVSVPGSAAEARTQAPPVALQVGGEIIRRFNGTDTTFQLRLDPPDLGPVTVRLDVSRDHRVTAIISADSPQALSDLARGARDLQQALQSAGLDLADDGLRFDLSSNGQGNAFAQAQAQQDQPGFRAANAAQAETSIAPEITAQRPLSIDSWRGARVDLMA